jgi:hypothetical protein
LPTNTKTVLPTAAHNNLNTTSAPIDVPANLLAFTLRMVSTQFTNPSLICNVQVDQSFDGGATWQNVDGFEAVGGFVTKNGPNLGQPLQPQVRVDLSREQRDAALMRATLQTQGSWVYGFALDLET